MRQHVVETQKQALKLGWQAQSTLESMLKGWRRTLSTCQQSTDESHEGRQMEHKGGN